MDSRRRNLHRPTTADVAKRAGVSKMSVSRTVRNPDSVTPETRARIQSAIRELGYEPASRSRTRPSRQSGLIAVVVTDVTNPFFTKLARGVGDVAHRTGYTVVLCNSDEDLAKEREYLEELVTHQLDGVVLVPAGNGSRENLPLLQKRSIPFILCDRRVPGVRADLVLGDSVEGARRLTEHLLEQGYRRIALLSGTPDVSTASDRRRGYELALGEAGLPVRPDLIVQLGYSKIHGKVGVDELRSRGASFDALLAANNALATGAVVRLRELRVRIPEDLGVACFDDLDDLAELYPFFTVMAQPALNFGTLSAQMLVERMQGNAGRSLREVVLVPELIVRASSRRPSRAGQRSVAAG